MIRFDRGAEPRGLSRARKSRLEKAVSAYNAHGAPSDQVSATLEGYGSEATKAALYLAQHRKCAWCERRRDFSSSPVEHYRPKDGAWRHLPGQPFRIDDGHYWWLTWSWPNLLFSCQRCNDRGHKANYFPLAAGANAQAAPVRPAAAEPPAGFFDVSSERPMLLNPTEDDPLDHIVWRPVDNRLPRERWSWSPVGITARGKATIAILKLDELADEVEEHLLKVLATLEEVEKHIADGRTAEATSGWSRLLTVWLKPESSLRAATWCALERWMPASERKKHGLTDPPRPG